MSESLNTLLEHSERQRDAMLAAVRQADDAAGRIQQQVLQLQGYRQEIQARHPAQGGRCTSIDMLRTHQGFVQRLDDAIEQVQGQLQSAQSRAAHLRSQLLALETRVASVRKLQQRRSEQASQVLARQEQRRSDEAASRPRNGTGGTSSSESGQLRDWQHTTQTQPL